MVVMMVELNACHNFSACIFICLLINLAEIAHIGNRFFARQRNLFLREDCHALRRDVALLLIKLKGQEQK
ncbi:hypothetical protein B1H58_14650 [Pantoea alhagi]|uniref:Uncharacterized protein n=1 Tax=Pantoea alhagi TaxID=1891675 RepID=A0A1W6B7S0_9GAMM|nr:hypothetical protein B1H58_14650 [Pantoea alhagi]